MSRVLISDNAALFQMLEPSFVRRGGWSIERASRASDVFAAARRHPPDVILIATDRDDPDGPRCLDALKSDPRLRPIPVMVIVSSDDAEQCRRAGADATLTLPVIPEAVTSALSSLARVPERAGKRLPVRIAAQLVTTAGPVRGRIKDLSTSGLFLASQAALPAPRASVEVTFRVAQGARQQRLKLRGSIARRVLPNPDSHLIAGVGIRFVDLPDEMDRSIRNLVNDMRHDAGPTSGGER